MVLIVNGHAPGGMQGVLGALGGDDRRRDDIADIGHAFVVDARIVARGPLFVASQTPVGLFTPDFGNAGQAPARHDVAMGEGQMERIVLEGAIVIAGNTHF